MMADFRAIAGVSRTLKALLIDRMELGDPFSVTLAPPDVKVDGVDGRRVNLYLYQVTENAHLKNQEIPGQGHPAAYGHPPLSLDLHYLLTAHGSSETAEDGDEQAQIVLGAAMRVLHDTAIVTAGTVGASILDPSLQGEFEQIKITLQPLNLEDLSKIWTALPAANFRRSVAYQVSVIQVESRRERRFPRLVGEPKEAGPKVFAIPFRSPQIREIRAIWQEEPDKERPFLYARIGDTLVLLGRNFVSESTRVTLDTVEAPATVQDRRIEVVIPDDPALRPGPQTVKVIQDVIMGGKPHVGFQSNLAVFMLVPRIDNLEIIGATLTITGARLFHPDLESLTLIGDRAIRSAEYTSVSPTEIVFDLPAGLGAGEVVVRVRVNGAESVPEQRVTLP